MGSNPEWFTQVRARGLCYICKRQMPDDLELGTHRICARLLAQGWRYGQIQEYLRRHQIDPNAAGNVPAQVQRRPRFSS